MVRKPRNPRRLTEKAEVREAVVMDQKSTSDPRSMAKSIEGKDIFGITGIDLGEGWSIPVMLGYVRKSIKRPYYLLAASHSTSPSIPP